MIDNIGNMTDASPNLKKVINWRLLLVCFVAASMGLPVAVISIGKLFLFLFGFLILVGPYLKFFESLDKPKLSIPKYTSTAILVVLFAFSLSLFWTSAESAESLGSIAKYGKLLTILLIPMLLRDRQEVFCVIKVFVAAQLFLVTSSWMLFAALPVPWAISKMSTNEFVVFSSYIDQGIMGAVTAAICWHLRDLTPGRYGKYAAIAIACYLISNVLFVLTGRSGHVVSIALLSLALMWQLKPRYRWAVVALPILLLFALSILSPKLEKRISMVKDEVQAFSAIEGADIVTGSSSGIRLQFWHRAVQSIAQSPWLGSGVGSWSNEYNRLEGQKNPTAVKLPERANPHQEYLQWGVQLGIPGIFLFLTFLIAAYRDTMDAKPSSARAAQSVLAATAVACLFNSSIYDALIGDFLCVALGLMLALILHTQKSNHDSVQTSS